MRCVSQSAEKQQDIEINVRKGIAEIYLRADHQEAADPEGEGTHWECEEAYMMCAEEDAPSAEEIEEDFEAWFEYAAEWQPPRMKSMAQLQADIEYIAAMTGVELEV